MTQPEVHPLLSAFERHVGRDPHRPAAADTTMALSYGQLRVVAGGLAQRIIAQSSRPHVGIAAPSSAAGAAAVLACWYAGRVPVPLNFLLAPNELGKIVADAELDLLLAPQALAGLAAPLRLGCLELGAATLSGGEPPRTPERGPEELGALIYTSGTSGTPKGVRLTFGNLAGNARAGAQHAAISSDEVFLGVIPPFHSFGFTMLIALPLWVGARTWYLPRFSPTGVIEAITQQQVTVFPAIASMFAALARLKQVDPAAVASLRLPISGGEPLPRQAASEYRRRFGRELLEGYGLTETSPVVSFNLPDRHRAGSVGRAIPGVEVVAADESGAALPSGEVGELLISGHCVMQGYHHQPEATAAAIRDGRLQTGDMGFVDADGFIFITGRKKEMLIVGGENVFPREIEAVLLDCPGVAEAAVIGETDPVRGETPVAYVEPAEGVSLEAAALREWCRARLAAYKVPRRIVVEAKLPRGPTGKVLKRALGGVIGHE